MMLYPSVLAVRSCFPDSAKDKPQFSRRVFEMQQHRQRVQKAIAKIALLPELEPRPFTLPATGKILRTPEEFAERRERASAKIRALSPMVVISDDFPSQKSTSLVDGFHSFGTQDDQPIAVFDDVEVIPAGEISFQEVLSSIANAFLGFANALDEIGNCCNGCSECYCDEDEILVDQDGIEVGFPKPESAILSLRNAPDFTTGIREQVVEMLLNNKKEPRSVVCSHGPRERKRW